MLCTTQPQKGSFWEYLHFSSASASKAPPTCFLERPDHHLGGEQPNKPSAVKGWLVSAPSPSIHHPIHALTASLKDVASIAVIVGRHTTRGNQRRAAAAPGFVGNILPSAVEGPRREIERGDKDKIKLCFVLIARSLVKGGQPSCRGGDRRGARLRLDGQEVAFFPLTNGRSGCARRGGAIQEYREARVFSRRAKKIVPDWCSGRRVFTEN